MNVFKPDFAGRYLHRDFLDGDVREECLTLGTKKAQLSVSAPMIQHSGISLYALSSRPDTMLSLSFSELLIDFFRHKSAQGEPQLTFVQLSSFASDFRVRTGGKLEANLEAELSSKLFVETQRVFEGLEVQRLYSLRVLKLSVESIIWTLRSLEKLRVMPSDKNVCVRLKEIFGTEIESSQWRRLLRHLVAEPGALEQINQRSQAFGQLTVERAEKGFVLGIKGVSWPHEDKQPVDVSSPDYLCFLSFVKQFLDARGDPSQITCDDARNIVVWLQPDPQDPAFVRRAVTNGNFGFSNFIKLLGPDRLRKLSMGKISAFVRTALHTKVLVHHVKFIISNPHLKNRERNLREAQQLLIQLLRERPEGIALSRLPSLLSKLSGKNFDCYALGFAKFKQFVSSLGDQITIASSTKSHARVLLSHPAPEVTSHDTRNPSTPTPLLKNRLALSLSAGREYEERARALLHLVAAGFNSQATLTEIEQAFTRALVTPLDLSYVCCSSVADFIVQTLGENIYMLKKTSSRYAPRLHDPKRVALPDKHSLLNCTTATLNHCAGSYPSASLPFRLACHHLSSNSDVSHSDAYIDHTMSDRELKRLNNLLNDDF